MRRFFVLLLPTLWIAGVWISFHHPGDEYLLFGEGAIAGAWIVPLLKTGGGFREILLPLMAAGGAVTAFFGMGLDALRVPRRVWLGCYLAAAASLLFLLLAPFPSWERAMAKNGSLVAYLSAASNFSVPLAALLAAGAHLLRRGPGRDMPVAFPAAFLGNVALDLLCWVELPVRPAVHFGLGGAANGWSGKPTFVAGMLLLHAVAFCSLYFSPRWIFAFPPRLVNLPNRDYWLAAPRRAETRALLATWMGRYGTALFLFLLAAGLLTVLANQQSPPRLHEPLFLAALVAFLAYTAWWCVALYRAFRIPGAESIEKRDAGGTHDR